MPERALLLSLLIDNDVKREIRKRLSVEQRTDLVMEIINPHRPLTSKQIGDLAGVTARAVNARKTGKRKAA